MSKLVKICYWVAVVFFGLSLVSYLIDDLPFEATYLVLVAIFLHNFYDDLRLRVEQKRMHALWDRSEREQLAKEKLAR